MEVTRLHRPNKTRSSATADIARDADDVDRKFREVTVHLTKDATEYYSNSPSITHASLSNHVRTQRRPMCSPPTNLARPLPCPFNSRYCFRNAYRIHSTVPWACGLESALYTYTPPLFQVQLEKTTESRWTCFGVRVPRTLNYLTINLNPC